MINEIYSQVIYFLNLTANKELLWIIYPLALVTIIILIYFEKYRDEKPGWNTHVANSLVLIFISSYAFRYFFSLNGGGVQNIELFPIKFAVCILTLILGLIILLVNFEHILPEKISRKISSPLTLNIIAYLVILFVYSTLPESLTLFISLFIIFLALIIILNILRIISRKIFLKLKKLKEKEEIENITEKKKELTNKQKDLKSIKKKIKSEELKKIKKRKQDLKKIEKISKKNLISL